MFMAKKYRREEFLMLVEGNLKIGADVSICAGFI